jgi:hypothetical protein
MLDGLLHCYDALVVSLTSTVGPLFSFALK